MPENIVVNIVVSLIVATIPLATAFWIAWGKVNERVNRLRTEYDDHIEFAEKRVEELNAVTREHQVMRAEIQHIAARLIAGDRRMDEITALARGVAIVETELKGIRSELQEIKTELKQGRA